MRRASALAALVLAGTPGGTALAQTQTTQIRPLTTSLARSPGRAPNQEVASSLSASISEHFEVDDNYNLDDPSPGTSYFADTRLGLGYANSVDNQTFQLGLDTGLRALWQAQRSFEFTVASPTTAALGYTNEWASGSVDANFDYRQRQVSFIESIDVADPNLPPPSLDQLQGDSLERRFDADVGVEFATDSPSSYALRFLGTKVGYSQDDPDQSPQTTLEGQATWTLQLNPVLASQVFADYAAYDADNDQNTALRVGEIDGGFLYQPSEVLQVSLGLGYADRQRRDTNIFTGERTTTQSNSGPAVRGAFNYTLTDFVVSGNARLTTAAPTTQFSGNLQASYALPRGRLTGRIFQDYGANSSGDNPAQVTGAGFGITRDLTEVSHLQVNFAVAHQVAVNEVVATNTPDINRLNLTATFTRDITDAVSAAIGYQFQSRDESPESATSNSVFFQIGRSFETLP